MADDYLPRNKILFEDVRDMPQAVSVPGNDQNAQALSDGRSYLWALRSATDRVSTTFARYDDLDPSAMIAAIERQFGTQLVGDDVPDWAALARQYPEDYYTVVIKGDEWEISRP